MSGGGKGFKISSMKMFGRLFEKEEEEGKKRDRVEEEVDGRG